MRALLGAGLAFLAAFSSPVTAQQTDTTPHASYLFWSVGGATGEKRSFTPGNTAPYAYGVATASAGWRMDWRPGAGIATTVTAFNGTFSYEIPDNLNECCSFDETWRVSGLALTQTLDAHFAGFTFGAQRGRTMRVAHGFAYPGVTAQDRSLPVIGLRLGPLTGFYLDAGANIGQPSLTAAPLIAIGVGLGNANGGRHVNAGISEEGVYAGGAALIDGATEFSLRVSAFSGRTSGAAQLSHRFGLRNVLRVSPTIAAPSARSSFAQRMTSAMRFGAIAGAVAAPAFDFYEDFNCDAACRTFQKSATGAILGLMGGTLFGLLSAIVSGS